MDSKEFQALIHLTREDKDLIRWHGGEPKVTDAILTDWARLDVPTLYERSGVLTTDQRKIYGWARLSPRGFANEITDEFFSEEQAPGMAALVDAYNNDVNQWAEIATCQSDPVRYRMHVLIALKNSLVGGYDIPLWEE